MPSRARASRVRPSAARSASSWSIAPRVQSRRSVATWSLRERPVCSLPATVPTSAYSNRSTSVCTSSVGAPDEDVHTLVERLLYAEVGTVAGKLHTGRSRNDQVATDLRLWTLRAIDQLDADLAALGRALVARAEDGVDILLPGYTHGQRAQPVRWAYVLLAHAWPLVRDRQRLADARRRVAELPLGSGALAGSGFAVDRVLLKEALGFRSVSANALDATGDRDFVAEVLFALTLVGVHLSRLAAELVLYSSAEFGFVRLSDDFSTGSSLLPQKRNPDVL